MILFCPETEAKLVDNTRWCLQGDRFSGVTGVSRTSGSQWIPQVVGVYCGYLLGVPHKGVIDFSNFLTAPSELNINQIWLTKKTRDKMPIIKNIWCINSLKTHNALPNIYKFIIPKDIYHDPFSNKQHRTIKFIPMQKKKKLSYPFFFQE